MASSLSRQDFLMIFVSESICGVGRFSSWSFVLLWSFGLQAFFHMVIPASTAVALSWETAILYLEFLFSLTI